MTVTLHEGGDARLLAEAMEWAAVNAADPSVANQHFNITNGDLVVMEGVYHKVAEAFGMSMADPLPMSLFEWARDPANAADWDAIVRKHDLQPMPLPKLVDMSGDLADALIHGRSDMQKLPATFMSTIKLRKAGFGSCVDTEEMIFRLLKQMQDANILPK